MRTAVRDEKAHGTFRGAGLAGLERGACTCGLETSRDFKHITAHGSSATSERCKKVARAVHSKHLTAAY